MHYTYEDLKELEGSINRRLVKRRARFRFHTYHSNGYLKVDLMVPGTRRCYRNLAIVQYPKEAGAAMNDALASEYFWKMPVVSHLEHLTQTRER